jgi:hypothetical protein
MPARRRARMIWAIAISAAVIGVIAAAAAFVVPWVLAETEPRTADGVETVLLRHGEAGVEFTPGRGWLVHPRFASDSTVDLVAPDQALTIEVEVVPEAPDAALARLIDGAADTPVDFGATAGSGDSDADAQSDAQSDASVETLASGLELRHVPTEHGLLAVVGTSAGSLTLTVRAGGAVDFADYRPSLSGLLETIRAE